MKQGDGRFRITDLKTGRKWDVEAIMPRQEHRADFGDSLDNRCVGAIPESESEITPETHSNIQYVRNPFDEAK